ncbi:hypothetical protein SASPL_150234 [Salvia splendens]|uniref:Uncharacterized protein n=1 Tax=Salvia splendens TaxID=180675 RepID=A0A8X8Z2A1_SALSN|nr:hypothetical protein SASPL_150234 [Salvia splendens]
MDQMVERSFLFTSAEISALRRSLPPHLQRCSKFEIVAGCVWRCQTIALSPKPDEEMKFISVKDNRKNIYLPLQVGYYGNVLKLLVAMTTAGEFSENPLHYAVELARSTKHEAQTACELSEFDSGEHLYCVEFNVHGFRVDGCWVGYGGVRWGAQRELLADRY